MKTVPPEKEYHDIEMQDDSFPETKITRSILNVAKKTNYQSNVKDNVVNDSLIHSESDTLIICSPELAASFQNPKTEKHKLSPGHYLQKVFLNSVAQKFRSQSLPSCLEKKKYQKNSVSDASNLDELNETSVPLVQQAESLITNIDARESFTEGWFKTWPERGIDKIPIRKGEEFCDDKVSNETSVSDDFVPDLVGNELQSNSQNTSKTQFQLGSKVEESLSSVSKESEVSKESLSNGDSEVLGNIDTKDKLHCTKTPGNSKSIPLDELLGNFPLAYSPITRQLLLITNSEKIPNQYSNLECNDTSKEIIRPNREDNSNLEGTVSDKLGGGNGWNSNSKNSECELSNNLHRVNRELSSFSSTVSSLSDTSPSTNEDSALGSLLDHGDTCSLVSFGGCSTFSEDSVGAKSKKKSLTGFLSRNVFNWKSGSRSDDSIAHSGAGWKLFSKNSSPVSSHSSLTVDHYAEADAWSTAPDSPCSVRSNSSTGPRTFTHESRVASSSALIQLDRPAHLPAKSEQEEARHRLEYQQMVEAARKKELKDAKLRKKQQQLQLRAEEQLAQAARVWTNEILPQWDQTHLSKKARELWWQGVPPCVRGKVWKLAIGNHLNLTHSLYDICVQRAQDRLSGGASSEDEDFDNKEDSMQLIQLDISRTFPHLCIFQKGGPYYDMLHCLLAAYVCYRPDVGYVQGMSFIAAVLILNMEAADAFVCFANLLNRPCHMAFFHLNQPLMQAYYSTYNELFKENLPQLFAHFTSTTLSPDLYLLDWIYTVFTKAMSLDLASRVWDVFLRDGEQFLFRTALGVLHLCQDSLLQMDFVHGSQFLTRLPDDLSGDQLFKSIACIKMTVGKQTFDDILAVHSIDCH